MPEQSWSILSTINASPILPHYIFVPFSIFSPYTIHLSKHSYFRNSRSLFYGFVNLLFLTKFIYMHLIKRSFNDLMLTSPNILHTSPVTSSFSSPLLFFNVLTTAFISSSLTKPNNYSFNLKFSHFSFGYSSFIYLSKYFFYLFLHPHNLFKFHFILTLYKYLDNPRSLFSNFS